MSQRTLALASALVLFAVAAHADDRPAPALVSVTGVAAVEVRPDTAIVTLSVIDDKPAANDAIVENARIATGVIDGLKASGVDSKDIQTVGLSLYPVMSEGKDPKTGQPLKPVISGFHASNIIRVRVRDIDRAGALVAASAQNGALYQGVSFEISDRDAREDALRVQAVVDARRRAALYAQGAELKLGSLRTLAGSASERPALYASAARAAAAPAPLTIEPGVITLSETVSATWELIAP